jgi:hypothetical protein
VKPGGRLLLLEHGRGTWDWVNDMLDSHAERHHKLYGCWYNRNILDIIKQVNSSLWRSRKGERDGGREGGREGGYHCLCLAKE